MQACPFCLWLRLRLKLGRRTRRAARPWLGGADELLPRRLLALGLALVLMLALLLAASSASAHENEANRATLVLRDQGHLSATFYIAYSAALHQALAPRDSYRDFLMSHAAMDAARFKLALDQAQAQFRAGIRLARQDGGMLTLTRWQWPAPAQVQRLLRERSMALMVGGHDHEAPQEITAELHSDKPIAALAAHFPAAFGPVMVVAYRPEQTMTDGKSPALLRFAAPR